MSKGSSIQYPLDYPRFKTQRQFPAPWTCAKNPPILPVPQPLTAVFTECNKVNQHCQVGDPCFMNAGGNNPKFPYSRPQVPVGNVVSVKPVWDADNFPTAYSDPLPTIWGYGM